MLLQRTIRCTVISPLLCAINHLLSCTKKEAINHLLACTTELVRQKGTASNRKFQNKYIYLYSLRLIFGIGIQDQNCTLAMAKLIVIISVINTNK